MRRRSAALLILVLGASCGAEGPGAGDVELRMSFVRSEADFYSAPFPSEDLRDPDGTIDLDLFPGDRAGFLAGPALELANHKIRGFGVSSAIYLPFTGDLAAVLPDPDASLEETSPVQLVDLDADPPTRRRVRVRWLPTSSAYGAPRLLALLPVQGMPLVAGHLHAAIVQDALGDAEGRRLRRSGSMEALLRGDAPEGLSGDALAVYRDALARLSAMGMRTHGLAGMAVFRTQDPLLDVREFYADATSRPLPALEAPLAISETHPDYCVFRSTIRMPSYQAGETPFLTSGGEWVRDAAGYPEVQAELETNVFVTVPRRAMPVAGFPAVVYVRAGGGGLQPLVDRASHPAAGDPGVPGEGPAMIFARAGFAAITIDGPVAGLRNPGGDDEQLLVFNTFNPPALLGNVRQYALETALSARILGGITIPAASSGCADVGVPGGESAIRFDEGTIVVFGHSMGASVAPLAAAIEPRLRALILSGAGGSWIENVVYKEHPIEILPFVRFQWDFPDVSEHEPAVSIVQWVGESSDAQVYAPHLVHAPLDGSAPRRVLMFQGIVDHYILPPIANVLSLAGGFDLAGQGMEAGVEEIASMEPLASVLPWVGRGEVAYPVQGNVAVGSAQVTAAVAQYLEDGIEDGHEIFFQREEPRHQAQCFLASLAAGQEPVIVAPAGLASACP